LVATQQNSLPVSQTGQEDELENISMVNNVVDTSCSMAVPESECDVVARKVARIAARKASKVAKKAAKAEKKAAKKAANAPQVAIGSYCCVNALERLVDKGVADRDHSKIADDTKTMFLSTFGPAVASCIASTRVIHGSPPGVSATSVRKEVRIVRATSLQATEAFAPSGQTCVLNFASGSHPCGGFPENKLGAQEESLARASTLFPSLNHVHDTTRFYEGSAPLYSGSIIMTDTVTVFRGEDGELLATPYTVAMCTAPAVNFYKHDQTSRRKDVRRKRMKHVLDAMCGANSVIILGAWGCGCFRNDPKEIAEEFRALLGRGCYDGRTFVFAIPDDKTFSIFKNCFDEAK
tara:strand:+ start:3603 stop:4652 length:1050 start_codon:yes stop_codon:yes gene_type:complete